MLREQSAPTGRTRVSRTARSLPSPSPNIHALDVRRLGFLRLGDGLAVGADDPLAHVELPPCFSLWPMTTMTWVLRRLRQATRLGAAVDQRVVVIALDELHAPGRRIEPDEPRIAGQPGLGKGDQLRAVAGGLGDPADRRSRRQRREADRFSRNLAAGYPWFIWLDSPAWGMQFVQRYHDNSLIYGSAQADRVAQAGQGQRIWWSWATARSRVAASTWASGSSAPTARRSPNAQAQADARRAHRVRRRRRQ